MTDEAGQEEIPKGSEAVGRRVRIPADAKPPITVFINGIEQAEGSDYKLTPGGVLFTRQIVKEQMNTSRWLAMYLGLFGTYRKHETVDVQFTRGGRMELMSDLPILPD